MNKIIKSISTYVKNQLNELQSADPRNQLIYFNKSKLRSTPWIEVLGIKHIDKRTGEMTEDCVQMNVYMNYELISKILELKRSL
jgi:hypothetical protein